MPTTNDNYDWLTYETVFNKPKFRKSNEKFKMLLYLIPRDKVTVWLREELEKDELLTKLTDAFFPDYDPIKHLKASNQEWEWKNVKDAGDIKDAVTPQDKPVEANRDTVVIQQIPAVVMPYNIYDNGKYNVGTDRDSKTIESRALGTKFQEGLKQLKEEIKWEFWKTASRSCVVRLERVKEKKEPWTDKVRDWENWNTELGKVFRYADPEKTPLEFRLKETAEPTLYSLATFIPADVSLKTGVNYVGSEIQADKDVLDDNWIVACLRSDYVVTVNQEMKDKRKPESFKQDIVVLTELLSITEKNERDCPGDKGIVKVRDGVQVRDLSLLDKTKFFLGPLSIPFVGLDLKEFHNEFDLLKDKEWCNYWKKHWAVSLGQAKALFLLRYGLQHINPNVQNYLIEFEKGDAEKLKPTGRIIIRDLQDAAIHREVVWALYGLENESPPEGAEKKAELSNLKLPILKYEFEKALEQSQETGSTDTSKFGPSGTQFLWQRFSSFINGDKIDRFKDQEPFKSKWRDLLATMADWGTAHNREYVHCIERQLGINFMDIKWDEVLEPERYREIIKEPIDKEEAVYKVGKLDNARSECISISYKPNKVIGTSPPKAVSAGAGNFPFSPLAWKNTFGDTVPPSALGAVCLLIQGENFQNPSVKIENTESEQVLVSTDGKKLYAKVSQLVHASVRDKKASVITVVNHEDTEKTKPVGSISFGISKEGDMGWEENNIKVVHDYLRSKEGQKAIRAYKERGWEPRKPAFQLLVSGVKDKPLEAAPIKITHIESKKTWTDITDSEGKIYIYEGISKDYEFSTKETFKIL